MLRYVLCFFLFVSTVWAEDPTPLSDGPVVVYASQADFAATQDSLKSAITNQGLLISGELHIGDMLARTGADLGFAEPVFAQAVSIEFCSALMAHRMAKAHPANLANCPFTMLIYTETSQPDKAYLAFRAPQLLGDADGAVSKAILEMLHNIAGEAAGGGW